MITRYPQDSLELKNLATGNKKRRKRAMIEIEQDKNGDYLLTATVPENARPLQEITIQVAPRFNDNTMCGFKMISFGAPDTINVDGLAPGKSTTIKLPKAPFSTDMSAFTGYKVIGYDLTGPHGNTLSVHNIDLRPVGKDGKTFIEASYPVLGNLSSISGAIRDAFGCGCTKPAAGAATCHQQTLGNDR